MSKKRIISFFNNEVYSDISSQSVLSVFETLILWFLSEMSFILLFSSAILLHLYVVILMMFCKNSWNPALPILLWISSCTTHNENYTTQTPHVSMEIGDIQRNHHLANELEWNIPLFSHLISVSPVLIIPFLCHRWPLWERKKKIVQPLKI